MFQQFAFPGDVPIPVLVILGLAVVGGLLLLASVFTTGKKIDKMTRACRDGEYEKALPLAEELIAKSESRLRWLKTRRNRENAALFHVFAAVSCLALGRNDEFSAHLDAVPGDRPDKTLWLGISALQLHNDAAEARLYLNALPDTQDTHTAHTLLTGCILYAEGQTDEAEEMLAGITAKLNQAYLISLIRSMSFNQNSTYSEE